MSTEQKDIYEEYTDYSSRESLEQAVTKLLDNLKRGEFPRSFSDDIDMVAVMIAIENDFVGVEEGRLLLERVETDIVFNRLSGVVAGVIKRVRAVKNGDPEAVIHLRDYVDGYLIPHLQDDDQFSDVCTAFACLGGDAEATAENSALSNATDVLLELFLADGWNHREVSDCARRGLKIARIARGQTEK